MSITASEARERVRREVQRQILELEGERLRIMTELKALETSPNGVDPASRALALRNSLADVKERLTELREVYSLVVLENLETYSDTLTKATKELAESSLNVEYLTAWLIGLTFALADLTFIVALFDTLNAASAHPALQYLIPLEIILIGVPPILAYYKLQNRKPVGESGSAPIRHPAS